MTSSLVIPYAYKPYYDECVATLKIPHLGIDNTVDNKGVAESWNLGIDQMRKDNTDWLIVCSAAIRFGEPGGQDMLEHLDKTDAHIVHFSHGLPEQTFTRGNSPSYDDGLFGWHLTAISRQVIEDVGYFDSNFYPSYFEDIDYDLRVNKFYKTPKWLILPIDASPTTIGHAVQLGGIKTPVNDLIAYFATKWGRHPSAAQLGEYDTPFNEGNIKFFPPVQGRIWNE